MEPLSIATGCIGLISTIGTTSSLLTSFVCNYRAVRNDLDDISRNLTSIQNALNLLKDKIGANDEAIPEILRMPIVSHIGNCRRAVEELDKLRRRYTGGRITQAAVWAITGKKDAEKLRLSLAEHKATLNLTLQVLNSIEVFLTSYVFLRDHYFSM